MKKILFPTEFSENAANVFQYVVEFAHRCDAEIILLHVIPKSEFPTLDRIDMDKKIEIIIIQLEEFAEKNIPVHYDNINYTCVVEYGFPQDGIYQVAKSEEVDLILMGMQGANFGINKILGSISTAIIREVDSPVLVIPKKAKFSFIDHLVYTLGFEFRDLVAMNLLKEYGKDLGADVHCVHILEPDEKETIVIRNIETLYELYKNKKQKIGKVTFEVVKGNFEEEIINFTKSVDVDILTMATHKRNLLKGLLQKNTTVSIANKIQVPLLVLKID